MKIDKEAFGAFFDGTPGKSWDDYAARLKNLAAGEVDDRGFSLADHYLGTDEGGTNGGPAMPAAGTADGRKAAAARRIFQSMVWRRRWGWYNKAAATTTRTTTTGRS